MRQSRLTPINRINILYFDKSIKSGFTDKNLYLHLTKN